MRVLSEQVDINAPAQAVWEVLADFGGVADWAPYMRKSHLIGDLQSGIGTRRGMRHAWGFRFEESVTEWNEGDGYSFDVFRAPFPMKDVKESWIAGRDNGLSTVSTRVTYEMHLGPVGRILDWMMVRFIVQREMRAGLRGLKQYLETGAGKSIALQHAD
ncbi:MAG: hypothetical protein GWP58_07695 [Gammaproteobacteria bacterium]|jgi:hypothetical protein|nr:hypothetical protein [Gammaproteobacteria bacterium]